MSKLVSSKSNPPLGALITANALSTKTPVAFSWGQETSFTADGAVIAANSSGISRYVIDLILRLSLLKSSNRIYLDVLLACPILFMDLPSLRRLKLIIG